MLHCNHCGHANLDDSSFCAKCGGAVESIADRSNRTEGQACPACSCMNEEHSIFCRACGQKLRRSERAPSQKIPVAAAVGLDALRGGDSGVLVMEEDPHVSVANDIKAGNPAPRSTRHESFIAKLNRMEQELESRVEVETEPAPPEIIDENQEKLDSMSSTLDALIADLLEVEINEYSYPDFIHPDESGFPSRDAASYADGTPGTHKKRGVKELLLVAALIAAIFLVGLSFGLWGAYFMGI